MLKLILGMLSLVISRKSVATKLKEASELYLAATTEEEKTAAIAKLAAMNLLFAQKFSSTSTPKMMDMIVEELKSLNEEIKNREESKEDIDEILSEIAETVGSMVGKDDEDDDEEFHVHDCDTCGGKGNCPIEQVMRDVKAGKLTPKEGDEAAKAIIEGLEDNQESPETITLPTVVAEA